MNPLELLHRYSWLDNAVASLFLLVGILVLRQALPTLVIRAGRQRLVNNALFVFL